MPLLFPVENRVILPFQRLMDIDNECVYLAGGVMKDNIAAFRSH
jgi:hypothetical protein